MKNAYYIKKYGGYYRPNCCGYTSRMYEAGIYPEHVARDKAKCCSELELIKVDVKLHNKMINDKISILKSYLIEL